LPLLFRTCFAFALLSACSFKTFAVPCQTQAPVSCSAAYRSVDGQSSVSVAVEPSQPQVRSTIQVAAHQSLQYNFALTRGATLVARFQVSGGANDSIKVWLLDAANFQRYQAHQQFNYFKGTSGSIRNTGNYVFRVPQDNIYYLVLDNSGAWLLPRNVHLYVYDVLPAKLPETLSSEKGMAENFSKLGEIFVFPSFRLDIKHCGMENAFSNPDITICTELVESLTEQHLEQALEFVFFHELGHTFLRQWGYPLWDNEDAADEFAAVMLILAKRQQAALQAAQWWASQTSQQEALSKLWIDDRHTVSPQRARNITHWLNQPNDLLQRWFRVFVPNMQTSALLSALNDGSGPINREVVHAELRKRGCAQ
jgi:hypothetical protein